jgi:hypothetical protein
MRRYTERSSLSELIRRSIKALQEGAAGPVTGAAIVPGTAKRQVPGRAGKGQNIKTTTVSVPSQDWRYTWSVAEVAGTSPGSRNKESQAP